MRYEMMNSEFGLKKIAPNRAARDNIIVNSKKVDNKAVWFVNKELPDLVEESEFSIEQLKAMLAKLEGVAVVKTSDDLIDDERVASMKAEYKERFGKSPHPAMAVDKLRAKLDATDKTEV